MNTFKIDLCKIEQFFTFISTLDLLWVNCLLGLLPEPVPVSSHWDGALANQPKVLRSKYILQASNVYYMYRLHIIIIDNLQNFANLSRHLPPDWTITGATAVTSPPAEGFLNSGFSFPSEVLSFALEFEVMLLFLRQRTNGNRLLT